MNRRGLVMAKKTFYEERTLERPNYWPFTAEAHQFSFQTLGANRRLASAGRKASTSRIQASARKKSLSQVHGTGVQAFVSWYFRKLPEEETSWRSRFCGGTEIFQNFFVMNRIVRLWHFFQKILLFSSCFEAVNSNPPPPRGACVAKLTPGQHKNQISAVLKGVFIC